MIVKKLLIGAVKLYQMLLSPLKSRPCCRFYPTCSNYAIEAFNEWGAVRGMGLTLFRILRCNPFCRGGIDNVPVNSRKREPRMMTAGKINYRGRTERVK